MFQTRILTTIPRENRLVTLSLALLVLRTACNLISPDTDSNNTPFACLFTPRRLLMSPHVLFPRMCSSSASLRCQTSQWLACHLRLWAATRPLPRLLPRHRQRATRAARARAVPARIVRRSAHTAWLSCKIRCVSRYTAQKPTQLYRHTHKHHYTQTQNSQAM